jgi:hypothetical protein
MRHDAASQPLRAEARRCRTLTSVVPHRSQASPWGASTTVHAYHSGHIHDTTPGGSTMPTYMDMHDIPGVTAEAVAGAHEADLKVQGQYGVNYKSYWVDEEEGKVFCLVDAPDRETATRVHREAHGLEAHTLYEVEQGA